MLNLRRPSRFTTLVLVGAFGAVAGLLRAAAPQLTGSLTTVEGVRVLKLWGTPYERGYAHGFLLGNDILALIESTLLDPRTLKDPTLYETGVRKTVLPRMQFRPDHEQELQGMLAGIQATLGPEKTRLNRLGRDLAVDDLKAVNTLADWNEFFCSSFSAWGDFQSDGELITGRNLDFFTLPGLTEHHVVIAYLQPGEGRKRWISIAWPSLIGAYTAMNEEGVTINIHDVRVPSVPAATFIAPRTLALRDAIETAAASTAVDDVMKVLEHSPVMCGNNIHVSAPYTGQATPAAVLEWDSDRSRDGGTTLRVAAQEDGAKLRQAVLCTNHHRIRQKPVACDRFEKLDRRLKALAQDGRKIDTKTSQAILKLVAVPGTLQSVVFLPNRRELYLSLATAEQNAAKVRPVRLRLEELFKK